MRAQIISLVETASASKTVFAWLIVFIAAMVASADASANCAVPSAAISALDFNGGIWRYCDGTNWQPLGGSPSFPLAGSNGTATGPTYSFSAGTNTGMYSTGAGTLAFTTAASLRLLIDSSGNVGIGTTSPRGLLEVNGTIVGKPVTAVGGSTIDFSTGNKQYTPSNCGAFQFNNLKDGGDYTFVVKGGAVATCSFTAYSGSGTGALTVHMPPDHGATTISTHTMYNLMVLGTDLYVAWTPGY